MGNVNDYINSCSSGPSVTPNSYNEMDALVFAELSYIKFDEVTDTELRMQLVDAAGSEGISLQTYADIMLKSGVVTETDKIDLLTAIKGCDRYKDLKIANCMSSDASSGTQWAGITIKLDEDTSVIAFRGTDGTTEGWAEDFMLGYSSGTGAQQESLDYLKNCEANQIYLTGHSKGGNDAVSAYIMADQETRDKVIAIHNMDGPGVNNEYKDMYSEGYAELEEKLTSIYPEDSIIGQLLENNPGKNIFVEADKDSILWEHDGFKWHFEEQNGEMVLVETTQSELSAYLDKTLDNVLSTLTEEEREEVLNALIDIGIPAVIAGNADFSAILQGISGLSPQAKSAVLTLISTLLIWAGTMGLGYDTNLLSNDMLDQVLQGILDSLMLRFGVWLQINNAFIVVGTELVESIMEIVQNIVEDLKQFLNEKWEKLKGQFDGTYTDTYIEVNTAALTEAAKILKPIAGKLEGYRDEIKEIQGRMDVWVGAYIANLSLQRTYLLGAEIAYNKIAQVLEDIAETYSRTENAIKSYPMSEV